PQHQRNSRVGSTYSTLAVGNHLRARADTSINRPRTQLTGRDEAPVAIPVQVVLPEGERRAGNTPSTGSASLLTGELGPAPHIEHDSVRIVEGFQNSIRRGNPARLSGVRIDVEAPVAGNIRQFGSDRAALLNPGRPAAVENPHLVALAV